MFQPYVSVIRDPQTKRFRLYYNSTQDASRSHVAYMESADGVEFIRPHRELADPGGLKVGMGAYVIDDGPAAVDPSRRYKLAFEENGLFVSFSPDGLNWTPVSTKPVLKDFGDIIALSRDPIRKRYLLTCKVSAQPEDGYKGSTPNAAEGTRRLVGQSVSDDCVKWTPARRIIAADGKDEGITEFYGIGQVIARGGLLIGLLKVLRDDLAAEPDGEKKGIGYTCLAWTRDGETWHRDREPFMDRNPTPGTWDRAMTWGDCLLPVDDEVFIYYGGYARGHKVERLKDRQIGFARLKRDRFVARQGGKAAALPNAAGLARRVKAECKCPCHGRASRAAGRAFRASSTNFDFTDCTPIHGDNLTHAVRWKGELATLRDRPVQIEFALDDVKLYAFELST